MILTRLIYRLTGLCFVCWGAGFLVEDEPRRFAFRMYQPCPCCGPQTKALHA